MLVNILDLFNTFAKGSEVYDKYFLIIAFLLFLFLSAYSRSQRLRVVFTTIISFVVAREVISPIARFLYYRPWPFRVSQLRLLLGDSQLVGGDVWSFPTGHSAFLFAMATTIYLYNKKWGTVFFIYAILMNTSRIIAGLYSPLDSLAGILIGLFTSFMIFYFIEKRKTERV